MRRNKYRVAPKADRTRDGIVFASKKEMKRWGELLLLEKAGKICGLVRQPKLKLQVNGVDCGTYIADASYVVPGESMLVYEDVKGVKTPVYRLKKKLVKAIYGIEVLET